MWSGTEYSGTLNGDWIKHNVLQEKTVTICFHVVHIRYYKSLSSAFKNPFSWETLLTSVEIFLFLISCSLLCPSYVILFSWFAYRSVTCDVLVLWANGSLSAVMNGSPYAFNSAIAKHNWIFCYCELCRNQWPRIMINANFQNVSVCYL